MLSKNEALIFDLSDFFGNIDKLYLEFCFM